MIKKLKARKTNYSGIDRFFPENKEWDTAKNVVMVVGPMGSGKTGMLRMLATSLENMRASRRRPLHKYGKIYFEPEVEGNVPVYTLGFDLSKGEVGCGYEIGITRPERSWYWEFDPSYQGNKLVERWAHYKAIGAMEEIVGDPDERQRFENSPGLNLCQRVYKTFLDIDNFFLRRTHKKIEREKKEDDAWGEDEPRFEKVPDDAMLAVFMEHPDLHLDYFGKARLLEMLAKSIASYRGAVQFFMTSHDHFLITNAPECIYLDMYHGPPAKSTMTFSPPVVGFRA